jgi:hypothetical protein
VEAPTVNASLDELMELIPDGPLIVVCGREDDVTAWRSLLGAQRCLALSLDAAPSSARPRPAHGATDLMNLYQADVAGMDGSGWLAGPADRFDAQHKAGLLLPDPLDAPAAGPRRTIGARPASWRLYEDKTAVDSLWDMLGIARAPVIVLDDASQLSVDGARVDRGAGVVCSRQPVGAGPTAGGDGLFWWRGQKAPAIPPSSRSRRDRFRVMPLLDGTPIRLHGFVLDQEVVGFPPMELVTLMRPTTGTFFCAGAVQSLQNVTDLLATTQRLGAALREGLCYRGAFAIDGNLTAEGFRPTDFNARLTSAIEAAPADLRVGLQLSNLLAREGRPLRPDTVARLATATFAPRETYTLYGSATEADDRASHTMTVRWSGRQLVAADAKVNDGKLTLSRSARGWLLRADLAADRVGSDGLVGTAAPAIFALSDRVFGTNFGVLQPQAISSCRRPVE